MNVDRPGRIAYLQNHAGVIQLVECQLPKLDVAGSSPVARSRSHCDSCGRETGCQFRQPVFRVATLEAVANHGVLRPGARLIHKPFNPHDLSLAIDELLGATASVGGQE